eukprot:1603544-Rhodomonas_salina.1
MSESWLFPNSSLATMVKPAVRPTVPMLTASPDRVLPVAGPGRSTRERYTAVEKSGAHVKADTGIAVWCTAICFAPRLAKVVLAEGAVVDKLVHWSIIRALSIHRRTRSPSAVNERGPYPSREKCGDPRKCKLPDARATGWPLRSCDWKPCRYSPMHDTTFKPTEYVPLRVSDKEAKNKSCGPDTTLPSKSDVDRNITIRAVPSLCALPYESLAVIVNVADTPAVAVDKAFPERTEFVKFTSPVLTTAVNGLLASETPETRTYSSCNALEFPFGIKLKTWRPPIHSEE